MAPAAEPAGARRRSPAGETGPVETGPGNVAPAETAHGGGGRLCVAAVAGAKGVRGAVRLKTFTGDPAAVAGYPALEDEAGRPVRLTVLEDRARVLVVRIDGVDDRGAAEAMRGRRLYVRRADLPPPDAGEFYHADLIGLAAALACGRAVGTVAAVHDFGAGDVIEIEIEIESAAGAVLLPFTRETVPEVALAEGRLVIDPPPGLPGLDALLAEARTEAGS